MSLDSPFAPSPPPASPLPLALTNLFLVLAGCFLLLVITPSGPATNHVAIGLLLGTLFGQINVAAAWGALGPGPLKWRWPLSLAWLGLLLAAFAVNISLHSGPNFSFPELVACFFGQWLLVQMLLWLMALLYALRIRHRQELGLASDRSDRQFGLRQLMLFTAVIGVLLGVGRALVLAFLPGRDANSFSPAE